MVERADLVQAGFIALLEAVKRYDTEQNCSLKTFASIRIRGAMIDELRKSDPVSRGQRRFNREKRQASERLQRALNRHPDSSELAAEMEMSLSQFHHREKQQIIIHHGYDELTSDHCPVEDHDWNLKVGLLITVLASLSNKHRLVIRDYMKQVPVGDTAETLQVGKSRIHQIRLEVMAILKQWTEPHE